jgi:hypothetical protein
MKHLKYLFIILTVLLFTKGMFALPRYALRMGAQCVDCHVNPTGGEMRNKGGWHYGMRVLPMISPREKDNELNMSNEIGKNIEIGFDYRSQLLYSQELQKSTFQKMQGTLYIDAKIMDSIDVYGNYDIVNSYWEGYAVAHILPNSSYIKAGAFVPDFGIWLDDHTAYTRGGDLGYLFATKQAQGLIFDPRYNITGVEVGANLTDYCLLTASVGSPVSTIDFNSEPVYTASLKFTPVVENTVALMFGGSFTTFNVPLNYTPILPKHKVNMFGGFAGFGVGNFTLLGEYDIANDFESTGTTSSAQMIEASYVLFKGLEAVVRYDRFDPNTSVASDDVSRLNVGFSFYPYSFIEIIPEYRFQFETPSVNNDSFLLQFHFFY